MSVLRLTTNLCVSLDLMSFWDKANITAVLTASTDKNLMLGEMHK